MCVALLVLKEGCAKILKLILPMLRVSSPVLKGTWSYECTVVMHFCFASTEISAAEVTRIAEYYHTKCSCVIKTVEPRARATVEDLKAVVAKVQALEERGDITPWDEEHIPDAIVERIPSPGYFPFLLQQVVVFTLTDQAVISWLLIVLRSCQVGLASSSSFEVQASNVYDALNS